MPRIPVDARRARIRELLFECETLSVPDLARHFDVSEMTIRRDLDSLAGAGQVRRVHGGALVSERMSFEFDFHERRLRQLPQKQAIAAVAASLIEPGDTLFLDTGTTTLELAQRLKDAAQLTVITTSLAVAATLQFAASVRTILLGGEIRRGSADTSGALTEYLLERLTARVAMVGAEGIDLEGNFYDADPQLARVAVMMRERSDRTYILCDSRKIGQRALVRSGHLSEVDALITDWELESDKRAALEALGGVKVTLAGRPAEADRQTA
ncbi:MAG: Glycerol-3-phosphate regulon repressor [candidate division BRC1 bacterium ADurb.BinA292]|nr:MAG: Glycerol-3-phosphate regulon repressor [candidate division BRC1 bacterium ADurb.BinA292]